MFYRRLIRRLDEITRRFNTARLLVFLTVIWLIVAALGGAVLWTSLGQRWVSSWSGPLLAGAGLLLALACWVVVKLTGRTPRWVAGRIESRYPELDSRLRTAVEQKPESPVGRMGFLQEQVIREALRHDSRRSWTQVVPTSRLLLLHALQWSCLALCVLVLWRVFDVSRVRSPGATATISDAKFVDRTEMSFVVEPGDAEVERGTSLLVLARFQGHMPSAATLLMVGQDDESTSMPMSVSLKDPIFAARVPDVRDDFRYRVEFGDRRSETFAVTVFEYPEMLRADAHLEYPGYTGLEPTIVEDTRRVSAVEGTRLTLIARLNKPVRRAWLTSDDAEPIELVPYAGDENAVSVAMELKQSRRYLLYLTDDKERQNRVPPEIVVNVLPNQPPELKLAWPRRDVQVSPLEELLLKAQASDDFGVRRVGVAYHIAGKESQDVVLATDAASNQPSEVEHTVFFEELEAEPDQLLSYYFWAEDAGPDGQDRRVFSDMYFAEVRRFEEIFRQGEQPANGEQQQQERERQQQQQGEQGGQNGQEAERLADLQKQIINATWTLIRRETEGAVSDSFLSDAELLVQSQQSALEQVAELAGQVQDEQSTQYVTEVQEFMNEAIRQLGAAVTDSDVQSLRPALSAEQSAYQGLLRLRAREFEVVRAEQLQQQQQQQSSSSSSSQNRNRQQLDQLELRQSENRYETQSQAQQQQQRQQQQQQEQQAQQEERQILNRLRELARRQDDLNKKINELQSALEAAETETEREELERQLKRLRDEQQRILRDLDEVDQSIQEAQNREEMQEARQELQEARENVREAAEALEQQNLSQAAAEGTRAGRRFEQLRDEFRQRTSGQFDQQMREMQQEAQQLLEEQEQLGERIAESNQQRNPSLRGDQGREQIEQGLREQGQRLDDLLEQVQQTVRDAESSEPLLSQSLYDTWRQTTQQRVDDALDVARQLVDQGFLQEAQPAERIARQGIQQFNEGIQRAAESVLGDETEALRRARAELQELVDQLAQEIDTNDPNGQQEEQQNGQQQNGQQQDGQQQNGQRQNGQQQDGQQQNGQQQNGQQQNGQQQNGQQQNGQQQNGQQQDGQQQDGQRQNGQQQDGQQQNGQQQNGQQQNGQQQNGQQQNGQQQNGQQQNGQQQNGQQQNGQQQNGQQQNGQQQNGQQQNGQQQDGQQQDGQQQDGQQQNGQQQNGQQQNGQRQNGQRQNGQRQNGQQQNGQQQDGQQQDGQRQNGQQQEGGGQRRGNRDPNGRGGGGLAEFFEEQSGVARPLTGDDFREWSDRLRDVEEMLDDQELRDDVARVRDRAREVRAEYKRHSKEPEWPMVRQTIAEPLGELLRRVTRELTMRESPDSLQPIDRDPVPSEFSEQVSRYYEEIGKGN